jgi:hypothetical protein
MHMVFWRLKTKSKNVIILIIICFLILPMFVLNLKTYKPQSVVQFGSIKVGRSLPSFIGVSPSGREIGSTCPKGGKFYVHVVDEQLPTFCLDLECGKQAEIVVNKGGHLIGGSDFKYAKLFGIKVMKNNSILNRVLHNIKPFVEKLGWKLQTHWWRFETSLIVVADSEGRIILIYKNAGIKDVPRIIRDLNSTKLPPSR